MKYVLDNQSLQNQNGFIELYIFVLHIAGKLQEKLQY